MGLRERSVSTPQTTPAVSNHPPRLGVPLTLRFKRKTLGGKANALGARTSPPLTKKLAIAGCGGCVRDSRTTDSAMTTELRLSRTSPKCWTIPAGAIVPALNCPLVDWAASAARDGTLPAVVHVVSAADFRLRVTARCCGKRRTRLHGHMSGRFVMQPSEQSRKVMIVDDHEEFRTSVARLIRSWGYEVAVAGDGPSALSLAEDFQPACGIVDVSMPGMSGLDLARRIRQRFPPAQLYLIALTGHEDAAVRRGASRPGSTSICSSRQTSSCWRDCSEATARIQTRCRTDRADERSPHLWIKGAFRAPGVIQELTLQVSQRPSSSGDADDRASSTTSVRQEHCWQSSSTSWHCFGEISHGPRTPTSRSSCSTRPGEIPSSPPSVSASCREFSTSASSASWTTTLSSSTSRDSPTLPTKIAFADFLRLKYRGVRFDLVIAMQDVAVEFVNRNREGLFPSTPRYSWRTSPTAPDGPNATGLIHKRDSPATLALIEQLQPDVRNVFVVAGAAAYRQGVRARVARPDAAVRIPTRASTTCPGSRPRSSSGGWPDCPPTPLSTMCSSPRTARATSTTPGIRPSHRGRRPTPRPIAGSTPPWIAAS